MPPLPPPPPSSAIAQKALMNAYRTGFLLHPQHPVLLTEAGLRVHSQHEEDGILLFIFALIGTTNRRCVEVCCGDGTECNTANLVLNHRWIGLMFDGSEDNIRKGTEFYRQHPDSKYWPPRLVKAWITRENINALIESHEFVGEVDLFSLDLDGVDYWVWKELSVINPRVVVVEINHLWGPDVAVTVPYRPDFTAEFTQWGSDYAGASLQAFVKLARQKGYRLVGANAIATNAFFVRDDIACAWLPEVDPRTCFDHPRAKFGMTVRHAGIKDKAWEPV